MSVRALRQFGALREDAKLLGVGAGTEATIFYLTNQVRNVYGPLMLDAGVHYLRKAQAWDRSHRP